MLELQQFVRGLLNYLTLFADVLIVFLLVFCLYLKFSKKAHENKLVILIKKNWLTYVFIISAVATLGSLFFSEILKFEPCKLCWLQRIFMYPLPLLSLMAMVKKEIFIRSYIMMLSIIGGLIATYHYFLQVAQMHFKSVENLVNCGVVGYSPSCTSYFVLSFGYITIPMMSLSAFVLIMLIIFYSKKPLANKTDVNN